MILRRNLKLVSMLPLAAVQGLIGPQHMQRQTLQATTFRSTPVAFLLKAAEDDDNPDEEGSNLAAELFKMIGERNIQLDDEDLLEDEDDDEEEEATSASSTVTSDDDEEDDDEEDEMNIPQGAINAFLGYDTGDVGEKLAGNVTLTNDQLYSEMKERVLDTAGGFVDLVGGPRDEDDDDIEDGGKPKEYKAPETVPDSGLSAGEVVQTVLDALLHNDVPSQNRGVEILFEYSSPGSQIKNEEGLTPKEYADFLKETEYKVLFDHEEVIVDKGDYSHDGKKAFYTAKLRIGPSPLDVTSVNLILSTKGQDEDDSWLVDSLLIRPQSMRRRRRR